MIKKIIWLLAILFMLGLVSQPLLAEEEKKPAADYSDEPWERAALYLGAFFVDADSDLELGGGGVRVKVDGEDVLGLDETMTVFRADAFWRITRRNRVDFTYYALNRDGTNELSIDIPEPGGGTIPVGTKVKNRLRYDDPARVLRLVIFQKQVFRSWHRRRVVWAGGGFFH